MRCRFSLAGFMASLASTLRHITHFGFLSPFPIKPNYITVAIIHKFCRFRLSVSGPTQILNHGRNKYFADPPRYCPQTPVGPGTPG